MSYKGACSIVELHIGIRPIVISIIGEPFFCSSDKKAFFFWFTSGQNSLKAWMNPYIKIFAGKV